MRFIDSIKDYPIENTWNDEPIVDLVNHCDKLISGDIEQIQIVKDTLDEIKNESEGNLEGKFLNAFNSFWKIQGSYLLIEIDVITAYKYIFQLGYIDKDNDNNDIYYRFFARRIYTLAYETIKGLLKIEGPGMHLLKEYVSSKYYTNYTDQKKKFLKFIQDKQSDLQKVRNSGEAHKDDFNLQIGTLESLSVKDSIDFIFNFQTELICYRTSLNTLLGELIKVLKK